jgi:low temperature requirement protein LtrA
MWWIYFDLPSERVVGGARTDFSHAQRGAFIWGYGHLVVFASAAAVGAGLAATVDHAAGHADLTSSAAALSVTVPVSVYLVSIWLLHVRYKDPGAVRALAVPVAVVAILASSALGESVLFTGCVMAALIVVYTASRGRTEGIRVSATDSQSS